MAVTHIHVSLMPIEVLCRIARICGQSSAAQQALDELVRRRFEGEEVECYSLDRGPKGAPNLIVGPRLKG